MYAQSLNQTRALYYCSSHTHSLTYWYSQNKTIIHQFLRRKYRRL